MQKSLKFFTVLSILLSSLISIKVSAISTNRYGGKIYETPLEICQKFDPTCSEENAFGSFVSENEINIKSDTLLFVDADPIGSCFNYESFTLNLYSPIEFNGYFDFSGNIVINDFTETSAPTISVKKGADADIWMNGNFILNNLKTENFNSTALFTFGHDSTLIANNITHVGGVFMSIGSNQEITINGGNYETNSLVFIGTEHANKILINDANFKTTNSAVMALNLVRNNIEITSGTFESIREDDMAPEIFRVFAATSEGETKNIVESLTAAGSEFYDEEKETHELTYSNISEAPQKGETKFGLVSSKRLIVREVGGQGGEEESKQTSNEEIEVEKEEGVEISQEEMEETEENPNTFIDAPIIYLFGIVISLVFIKTYFF